MASISTQLNTINNAVYGRDMRTAIHDAIKLVNEDATSKEPSITAGTTTQYYRGDKTWHDFGISVKNTVLDSFSLNNSAITIKDTISVAFGKLQAQTNARLKTLGGTMTGNINMNGYKITSTSTPTTDNDYVNKKYADTKEPSITAGTTTQYYRGDKTWQDFDTSVRNTALTGFSLTNNSNVTATDNVLTALGKLQAQMNDVIGNTEYTIDKITAGARGVITISDYTHVDSSMEIANSLSVTGSLDVTGPVELFSTLDVSGDTYLSSVTVDGMFKVKKGEYELFSVDNNGTEEIYINANAHIDDSATIYWGDGVCLSGNEFVLPSTIRPVKSKNDMEDPLDFYFQDSSGKTMIHFNTDSSRNKLAIGIIDDFEYINMSAENGVVLNSRTAIECYLWGNGKVAKFTSGSTELRHSGNSKICLKDAGCIINGKIYMNKVDETADITTENDYTLDEINYLNTYSIQEILIDLKREINKLHDNITLNSTI